jgi:hypothetical protein
MIVDFLKESSVGVCFKDFITYAIRYSHVAIIPNVIVIDIPLIIAKVISIRDVNHGLQRIGNIHYPIDYRRRRRRVVCLSYIYTQNFYAHSLKK